MLEDFAMEKKPGRSGQSLLKGNATESKKNPDSAANKAFPRTSRRRESVVSQSSKYESNRKPTPQKVKSIDKRPKPRGRYYESGKEDTKVAVYEEVECGSSIERKNKKQNLNHLLNFHYAPRNANWRNTPGGSGRSYAFKSLKHKYNKEHFLQANCQFVVKSAGDYSSCMVNPDLLVDWEFIEQIHLRSSEMLSCPICLYPPVAAKMTRCGHVFCWSCILHYLALSDKTWRKCPICYEIIEKEDLKSVVSKSHSEFSVGDEITLCLMKRKKGTLIAVPVSQSEIYNADELLFVSETEKDTKFSKFLLASSMEVSSIIERERIELQKQLADEANCPETCFIEQAFELLKDREVANNGKQMKQLPMKDVQSTSNQQSEIKIILCKSSEDMCVSAAGANSTDTANTAEIDEFNFIDCKTNHDSTQMVSNTLNRQRYESISSEGLGSEEGSINVEDIEANNLSHLTSEGVPPKDFYFYQAADGQHIYLHAVNVRMLQHQYGCLQNSPLVLTGRIVEKESGSMTEDLRQRLRYLQHLPVTCPFEVVEIHLKPPIVDAQIIYHFQDQLEIRNKRRQRRAREECKREKRINEEENRRWGKFSTPNISINSRKQFPSCGIDTNIVGSNIPTSSTSSVASSPAHSFDTFSSLPSTLENLSIDGNPIAELSVSPENETLNSSGLSFAQMLREGKSKPGYEWPSVRAKQKREPSARGRKDSSSSTSDNVLEYESNTPLKPSLGDALALAMERAAAAATSPCSSNDNQDVPGNSGKKKKKQKQKQKLLFATGMACMSK